MDGSEIIKRVKEDLIFYAAKKNDFKLAKYCIDNGIGDVNYIQHCSYSPTPLMVACKNLNLKLIKLFLDNGASVEFVNFFGEHALYYILWNLKSKYEKSNNIEGFMLKIKKIVLLFLDKKININDGNRFGETILIRAVKKELPADVIAILLEYGADPFLRDKESRMAIDYTRDQQIKKLLNANNYKPSCAIL